MPKIVALFGANASGKTTILRAISFLVNFATRSFNDMEPGDKIPLVPFATAESRTGPTKLAIEFKPYRAIPVVFRYELQVQHTENRKNYVKWEAFRFSEDGGRMQYIFERSGDENESYIRAAKAFELPKSDPRRKVRPNVSLLSSLLQFDHEPAKRLSESLRLTFVYNVFIGKFSYSDEFAIGYFSEHDWALKALINKLRVIDVGISNVKLKEVDGKTIPVFEHRGLDDVMTLPFESQGTRNFFRFFPNLIYALSAGTVAVLDELDSDLHPALMTEILRWFCCENENEAMGQLIMSCQNPSILSELVKEEVVLVEKDKSGSSRLLPLAEFKGLRRDTNLYAKYLGGAFGGIPSFG